MPDPIPFINLLPQIDPIRSDLDFAINSVVSSGVFLNGPKVYEFEEKWARYCGHAHCVACASGTDAVMLGADGLSFCRGRAQWVVPANACEFTIRGLEKADEPFDICDVDMTGFPIGYKPDSIPVLLYGRQQHVRFTDHFQLVDACQAHGWKPSTDQVAAWSFYPTKNLGSFGDSGAVTCQSAELADAMRKCAVLYHSRMSEINAAILLVKLPHLDVWNAVRNAVADVYYNELPARVMPACMPGQLTNHHIFAILTERREELISYLAAERIGTKVHYPQPLKNLGGGTWWAEHTLSLPCYPGLTPRQVQRICDTIKIFWKG